MRGRMLTMNHRSRGPCEEETVSKRDPGEQRAMDTGGNWEQEERTSTAWIKELQIEGLSETSEPGLSRRGGGEGVPWCPGSGMVVNVLYSRTAQEKPQPADIP